MERRGEESRASLLAPCSAIATKRQAEAWKSEFYIKTDKLLEPLGSWDEDILMEPVRRGSNLQEFLRPP